MTAVTQAKFLYHFTTATFALDDLRNAHLKIAQVPDLNDPFELKCMDTSGQVNRMAYDLWRRESGDAFGLLCFTERWKDILQWSHYADRHRGVCLGFDVTGEPGKFKKVDYVSNKLKPPDKPDQDYMKRCLWTKFDCWKDEQEWRVFLTLTDSTWNENVGKNLYFADFGKELKLRHVILGESNTTPTREVFDLVAKDVRVSRVNLADDSFELMLTDCVRM